MAGSIKGITVEIGADTSKLSKALNSAVRPVKTLQSELKKVDALLKMNPGNVDLLRQKETLLAQSIEKVEGNLKQMKAALASASAAGATEKNSAGFRRLQQEIIRTEAELRNLRAQSASMSIIGSSIGQATAKTAALGKTATALGQKFRGVSVAAGLIGTMAVATVSQFDSAMSKVSAVSGATGSDFTALRDKAREMGETTKFTATEAAEAMNYMAMAGWKTQDMLSGIEGVMYLAAASGEDLATTSDIVTDTLTAMGYAAEDSGRLADVMAAASANANTNVSMMGETFKYAAAVAGSMGYSMEDLALATGLMANAGIKGTQAGTSLRSIISRMAAPTSAVASEMEKLGVSITDSSGEARPFRDVLTDLRTAMSGMSETEKTAAASTIAGKNAMSGFLALINASDKDFNKLASAIDNSNGAAENMADTMNDNFGGQITLLKAALQELAIAMGDTLVPTLRTMVSGVRKVVGWFNSLSDGTKTLITKLVVLAGLLSPMLIVFGEVANGANSLVVAFANLYGKIVTTTGAMSAFNMVQKATPWLAAAAGIALVVKAVVDTYTSMNKATIAVKEHNKARESAVTSIKAEATETGLYLQRLKELSSVENKTKTQKALMKAYVDKLNGSIKGLNLVYDAEKDKLNQTTEAIQRKIDKMKEEALAAAYVKNAQKAYEEYANAEIKCADAKAELAEKQQQWNQMTDNEKLANNGLQQEIGILKQRVEDYRNAMSLAIQDANKWSNASALTAQGWRDIKQQAQEAGIQIPQSISNGLRSGLYTVPQSLAELKALIKFDDLKQSATGDALQIANNLAQGLANGTVTAKEAAKKLAAAMKGSLTSDTRKAGEKAGKNYAQGVKSKADDAKTSGKKLHSGAKSGASGSLHPEGEKGGKTYGTGVTKANNAAKKAGVKLANSAKSGANKPNLLVSIGKSIGDGLAAGMKKAYEAVKKAAQALIDKANEAARAKAKVHSPSKLFRDGVGLAIPEGLAAGIKKGTGMVRHASARMIDAAAGSAIATAGIGRKGGSVINNRTVENGTTYNFGNITLEVSDLTDATTIEDIADIFRRAKAFA